MVGDDAVDAGQLAGGCLVGVLSCLACASRGRQCRARDVNLPGQGGVFGAGDAGALVEYIGILPCRRGLGGCAQGDLLRGRHEGSAQALSESGQRLPVRRRLLERGRGGTFSFLKGRQRHARRGNLSLQRGASLRGRLVRGFESSQAREGRRQVVREQTGLRVAHARLNEGSAPGNARLAGQRPQLTVDLSSQVEDAHEIRVHVRELLERSLLAAAMFEDACGLFDEAAPFLGRGGQDRVQLPLPHDDVHLAAHARVGEQLLDVQEPHGRTVDGILRAAPAEQGAADRHLRVLDVEQPVGIVNRQVHLGAPQRRAPRCPRENNVRHVRAAQRACSLLAHDPGESINDVRFT